jgi:hypothetical protein
VLKVKKSIVRAAEMQVAIALVALEIFKCLIRRLMGRLAFGLLFNNIRLSAF